MKKITGTLLTLLMAGQLAAADSGMPAPDAEELATLLHKFMARASKNDLVAHDQFWDDDLVYTSSEGQRFGKKDIIDSMVIATSEGTKVPDVTYLAENVRIRQYGDTAVVAFRLIGVTHEPDGRSKPLVENYYNTGTLVRRDGEWRTVAWQATRIPD